MNRSRTGRSLSSFSLQLPAAGDRIGERYQVVEQLGRGGTSVVYRVRDQSSPRELALKQLLREAAENRETSALFEREFHTLAQLSHPSVIEVYDFGVDAAGPFYTMELLDGGDLTTRELPDVRATCNLISQVCSSLALLHARRLVHRDVTARNVRWTSDGRAKLIDFGAMAPFGPCRRSVGTPAFTAPEVLYQLTLDARTDLFSLGVTLYFALTRKLPYAARSFAELHDAWRHEPSPPSRFASDVPPALDTLVLDLIHVDPTLRPRSASEVMHRLAAITGVPPDATHDFARFDLGSPTLVGRDAEQRRFRQRLHRTLYGQGSALWIEGAPGLGRSRLLETCVLDAKTQGAIVLHVAGSAAASAPFQTAHRMIEQLLEILPQAALEYVRDADALRVLFDAADPPQLLPFEALAGDRRELHATLRAWLQAVAARQPLMIALDDAHLADEASLALLSALAHSAHERPLILALAAESPLQPRAAAVLNVLRGQALVLSLAALTREQTEQLLGSLFGSVPQLALLAERIQAATTGNPREVVAFAQHLVDRKLIQHDAGTWVLPAELTLSILPADAESALRARITALPAQALQLLEAQSLARGDGFRRSDYALLARAAGSAIDAALAALVAQDLLQCDGELYTLRQPALRACLSGMLSQDRRSELHTQLAQLCAASGRPRLEEVHHWLFAGRTERGLDRLRPLLDLEHSELLAQSRLDVADVASTLASAFQLAVGSGRSARELCEIARHLTLLSRWGDDDWHARYGRGWLRHLRHDLGLSDDPQLQRAYTPEEALRHLTRYVTISTLIATRTHDPALSASLPKLLEPFAGFSPRLHLAWQASLASDETTFGAQPERGRARTREILRMLDEIVDFEPEYRESLRTALHYAEGVRDVILGTAALQSRLPTAARDPAQQVLAGYVARLVCIYAGDAEGAERERRQTEMLAVQAGVRPPFDVPLRLELPAYVHAQDLDGIKQVADRMAQLTARAPGWRTQQLLAIGCFERLRGDFAAAKTALETCIELTRPGAPAACPNDWVTAAASYVGVLVELDRAADACSSGLQVLEHCNRLGIDARAHDLVRELALAEAELGECDRAARRLDALIARRADVLPARRAIDYEARARVAIRARDTRTAAHFTELVALAGAHTAGTAVALRHGRLVEEARRAGIALSSPPTEFETLAEVRSRSAAPRRPSSQPLAALSGADAPARAEQALERLCGAARTGAGVLYLVAGGQLRRAAVRGMTGEPALDQFAAGHFAQQLEDLALNTVVTQVGDGVGTLESGRWTGPRGTSYRILLLKCVSEGALLHAGLAALQFEGPHALPAHARELAPGLAMQLIAAGDAEGATGPL